MRRKTGSSGKPRTKKFSLSLIVLILIFLGLTAYFLGAAKSWDGASRLTVVVQNISSPPSSVAIPLAIFSIEPKSNQAIFISIPGNTQVDVPFGYKQFPASTVFKLGQLDNKRGGGELLTKSTEATFKVAVDRYYVSDGILPIVALTSGEVVEIKSSLFSLSGLVSILNLTRGDNSQVYTNLSLVEKLRLWNSIRKLRPDQINFINLLETNILDEERQPDGSLIKIIDKDILKTVIADNFQDSAVRLENVTLEVVNATSEQRLAGQFSQILTNMGANVIGKSNSRSKQSGACLYFLKDKKYKRNTIIARVAELYSCKLLENYIQDSTADIVIILGEDFLK